MTETIKISKAKYDELIAATRWQSIETHPRVDGESILIRDCDGNLLVVEYTKGMGLIWDPCDKIAYPSYWCAIPKFEG
jgi:hypothetical protein